MQLISLLYGFSALVAGPISKLLFIDSNLQIFTFSDDDGLRVCRCCLSTSHLRGIIEHGSSLVSLLLMTTGVDVRQLNYCLEMIITRVFT